MSDMKLDANGVLQEFTRIGLVHDEQVNRVRLLLDNSQELVARICSLAGEMGDTPAGDAARQEAYELVAKMTPRQRADRATKLAKLMGMTKRELLGNITAIEKEEKAKKKKGESDDSAIETLGGHIHGWLVDYIYDADNDAGMLVWRDQQGKTGYGPSLMIDGVKYTAMYPIDMIKMGVVKFPDKLGTVYPEEQLAGRIADFIRRYYLLDDPSTKWIIAYYVMLTWIYEAFPALPYLQAVADKGSGKSELMKRVGSVCYRMTAASGANSETSFFRMTEMFKGTLFVDEADLDDGGDTTNMVVKFLNLGAMKGNYIIRMVENFNARGEKIFVPSPFDTFCPKLIAMRKDFGDDAVGSRSLKLKLMARETVELIEAKVPLHIENNPEFQRESRDLRNDLMAWRMYRWVPSIEMGDDLMDINLSARMNQVMMPLKALAKLSGNEEFERQITYVLREHAAEETLTRSMSIEARVVEAMWQIFVTEHKRKLYMRVETNGQMYIMVGDVCRVANEIMNDMNSSGDSEIANDDEKKKRRDKELTPQGTGHYIRNMLQLRVGQRKKNGYPVYWDMLKMQAMGRKYGVLPKEEMIAQYADRVPVLRDVEDAPAMVQAVISLDAPLQARQEIVEIDERLEQMADEDEETAFG